MNNFKILKSWLIQAFAVKFFTSQPSYIILRQEVSMLDEINIGFPLFASQEIRYVLSHRYTDLVFKDLFFPGRTSSSQVITTCWSLAVQLYSRTLSNNQCAPGQIKWPWNCILAFKNNCNSNNHLPETPAYAIPGSVISSIKSGHISNSENLDFEILRKVRSARWETICGTFSQKMKILRQWRYCFLNPFALSLITEECKATTFLSSFIAETVNAWTESHIIYRALKIGDEVRAGVEPKMIYS